MRKNTIRLLLFLFTLCSQNALAFEIKQLLGKSSQDTKLLLGSLFYHSRDLIDKEYREQHKWDNFRTAIGFTHKGWVAYYFYTTHRQHSVSLGIERNWYDNVKEKSQSHIGYRAGILYGYCSRDISQFQVFEECDENSKYHFSPMAQIFYNWTYKHIGFEIATAILMTNASIVYRF